MGKEIVVEHIQNIKEESVKDYLQEEECAMELIKKTTKKYFVLSVICFFLFFALAEQGHAVEYEYTVLLPEGWEYTSRGLGLRDALDINNNGVVVGYGGDRRTNVGFIYQDGVYTTLLPEYWASAGANGVNNDGVVVGFGTASGSDGYPVVEGFVYHNGEYTILLPEGWADAHAYRINDAGVVVGKVAALDQFQSRVKGFVYSAGEYTFLLPEGWLEAYAVDINNNGVVIGSGSDGTTTKGFIYNNGIYTELLPEGWLNAEANGINNDGVVVGYGTDSSYITKGFIYRNGKYSFLLPEGYLSAYAKEINDQGVVAGIAVISKDKGFTYNEGIYTFMMPEGWVSSSALGINNKGVVVGEGTDGDRQFVYMATPKVQPSCFTETLYGENSEQAELLRYFRDTVLKQTPEGRELIKLYYHWSPAVVKAMEQDEGFKEELKQMIDAVLPMLGRALK